MKNNRSRPDWLLLYLFTGVFLCVLWLEVKAPFSQEGHIWAEIVLVLSYGALVLAWLKANELAFLKEDRGKRNSVRTSPGWLVALISYLGSFFNRLF